MHQSASGPPRQVVHAAEQVALHLPIAGPTSRMLAYLLDWAILWTLLLGLLVALLFSAALLDQVAAPLERLFDGLAEGDGAPDLGGTGLVLALAAFVVLAFAAEVLYFLFWESVAGGRSPGKALLRLRVVRDGGRPLTLSASLVRNLMRVVDVLPLNYLVGFVSMLLSTEAKRLGDLAAGTVVVRLDRPAAAAPLALAAEDEAASTFRFGHAQLQRVGRAERALLRQTLRRLDRLPPQQRDEVLERSVGALCTRIGYVEEVPAAERAAFLRALLRAATRRG